MIIDFYCLVILFSLPSVPRLLFDGWSYQDYVSVLGSEDEIEELGSELVDVAKVIRCCCSALNPIRQCCFSNDSVALQTEGFDGFTLELWSQLGGNKRKWADPFGFITLINICLTQESVIKHVKSPLYRELVHLVKHICETLKAKRLDCILVIPPAVTR